MLEVYGPARDSNLDSFILYKLYLDVYFPALQVAVSAQSSIKIQHQAGGGIYQLVYDYAVAHGYYVRYMLSGTVILDPPMRPRTLSALSKNLHLRRYA